MSDLSLLSQLTIRLADADPPEALQAALREIVVESSLHMPCVATLCIHDPGLRWVDAPELEPGVALRVEATVGQVAEELFDGEIVELESHYASSSHFLTVRAFDRLHRLDRGRHARAFADISDGDLLRRLAAEAGLEAEVADDGPIIPHLFQANQSNLELLRQRAGARGQLLFVVRATLHCAAPALGEPVALQWGQGLSEFRPHLTTLGQVGQVLARGWDPDEHREILGEAGPGQGAPAIGERRAGGELAQAAFGIAAAELVADRPIRSQAAATALAQAVADRRAGQLIEAEGRCRGNPRISAGATARLSALGDRYSGDYLVTAACHRSSAAGYFTELSVSGLSPHAPLQRLLPPPPPRVPPGLALAVVTDNQDPEGRCRVKLRLPWLAPDHSSDWVRVVAPGAGAERGLLLLPEVDDEVLVGFELGDLGQPYVLGGLWSGHSAPPRPSDELLGGGQVRRRLIRSRSGHQILLDDDPSEGAITIEDRAGNRIHLDTASNSLSIALKGDATITAKGAIRLDAGGKLSLKGRGISIDGGAGGVDIDGSTIDLN
ncbi:VgrG-related protein [Oscillochloris sp. ZM17-4]|uniref:VgrG-related protein n=1 Tax=Oscillochloris sp. ZM17-4 TaxID=2866714 RepID=UPI001C73D4DD|nr:VgrG-related protein [Oscillochloris sp. ZM17-4]MBX0331211.1 VgrG-related protein [Oscillochloris sp. ZM17-4]